MLICCDENERGANICQQTWYREQQVEERSAAQAAAEQRLGETRQELDARQAALKKSRAEVQQLSKELQAKQVNMMASKWLRQGKWLD